MKNLLLYSYSFLRLVGTALAQWLSLMLKVTLSQRRLATTTFEAIWMILLVQRDKSSGGDAATAGMTTLSRLLGGVVLIAVRLSLVCMEAIQLSLAAGANKVLRMPSLAHGLHDVSVDRLLTRIAASASQISEIKVTVRNAVMFVECVGCKRFSTLSTSKVFRMVLLVQGADNLSADCAVADSAFGRVAIGVAALTAASAVQFEEGRSSDALGTVVTSEAADVETASFESNEIRCDGLVTRLTVIRLCDARKILLCSLAVHDWRFRRSRWRRWLRSRRWSRRQRFNSSRSVLLRKLQFTKQIIQLRFSRHQCCLMLLRRLFHLCRTRRRRWRRRRRRIRSRKVRHF